MSYEFYESVASGNASSAPQLTVQRIPERSSWVALPPALASQLYDARAALPLVLEVRAVLQRAGVSLPTDSPAYAAWGGSCGAAGALGVPAGLLGGLGLAEGQQVVVRPLWDVPAAVSVTVEPASEDDWEVVELNAEFLEGQLLSQVGVVSPRQPFPFWVHTHLINLKVVAMDPPGVPATRLAPGSEIHIAPRVRVRPGAKAGRGTLFGGKQGQSTGDAGTKRQQGRPAAGGAAARDAEQPLETGLRVQCISGRLAAACQERPPQQETLPQAVQPVAVSQVTLTRCGLREGDWVRLVAAASRSPPVATARASFGCLVACQAVAVGHVGLTQEQCSVFGAAPFSHVKVQRLGAAQRGLVLEAAELLQRKQGASSRSAVAGTAAAAGASVSAAGVGAGDGAGLASAQEPEECSGVAVPGVPLQPWPGAGAEGEGASAEDPAVAWLGDALEKAVQDLVPVLAATPRYLLHSWGMPRPGGLLVSGPAGSGKSALLDSAAGLLRRHPQCLTHTVVLRCREITSGAAGHTQALISEKVQEALDHMPSLLVLDDLDVLCPAEPDGPEGAGAGGDPGLVAWLCDVLDFLCTPSPEWGTLPSPAQLLLPEGAYGGVRDADCIEAAGGNGELGGSSGGGSKASDSSSKASSGRGLESQASRAAGSNGEVTKEQRQSSPAGSLGGAGTSGQPLWPPVAFAATCKDPAALAAPLRVAGRLDHPLALPAPSANSRAVILAAGVRARGTTAAPYDIQDVAERAEGFDAADLEVLLDRAMHLALKRRLVAPQPHPLAPRGAGAGRGAGGAARLLAEDLVGALEGMTPAAFWGVHTQQSVQQGVSGWEDVGGMEDVRAALYEALELPTKYAKLVAQAPLRLRTGVLLYGPPGCGKTHVVSAAVAAANVRCITVSGPELLNKYIGASEAAVRDVFRRAAAAAPSVLFFDEFDAIAPQRGHDNTGVTDRVVNQLLTELDGVEGLKGVCVVAATSRPDLIDAALLRPGRLDRLLYCGFPSPAERHKILEALARSLPLAPDIDLQQVAQDAEFFTGADLSAVLSEAQLAAVHETLGAEPAAPGAPAPAVEQQQQRQQQQALHKHQHAGGGAPAIARRHLEAALATARPSMPEEERERLEGIYLRFQRSREPGGGGAVDKGKGKKVSWA